MQFSDFHLQREGREQALSVPLFDGPVAQANRTAMFLPPLFSPMIYTLSHFIIITQITGHLPVGTGLVLHKSRAVGFQA